MRISNRFPYNPGAPALNPVTLPPGRARLATSPLADRVGRTNKDNWNHASRFLGRACWGASRCEDDIDLESNQLRREGGKPINISLRRSVFDGDVLSLNIGQIPKILPQCFGVGRFAIASAGDRYSLSEGLSSAVGGGTPVQVNIVRSIRHETTNMNPLRVRVYCRQPALRGEFYDPFWITLDGRLLRND